MARRKDPLEKVDNLDARKAKYEPVAAALTEVYGELDWSRNQDGMDELISCILSQSTNDTNRDRAFAQHPDDVLAGWAEAARNAGVRRVIWVGAEHREEPYPDSVGEVATVIVEGDLEGAARAVGQLEEAERLSC